MMNFGGCALVLILYTWENPYIYSELIDSICVPTLSVVVHPPTPRSIIKVTK